MCQKQIGEAIANIIPTASESRFTVCSLFAAVYPRCSYGVGISSGKCAFIGELHDEDLGCAEAVLKAISLNKAFPNGVQKIDSLRLFVQQLVPVEERSHEGGDDSATDAQGQVEGIAVVSAETQEYEQVAVAAGAAVKVGDVVTTIAGKQKEFYDNHRARVIKVLSSRVKVCLLEGPCANEEKVYAKENVKKTVEAEVKKDNEGPVAPKSPSKRACAGEDLEAKKKAKLEEAQKLFPGMKGSDAEDDK